VSGGGETNATNDTASDPTNIISLPGLPNTSAPVIGGEAAGVVIADAKPDSWLALFGVAAGIAGLAAMVRDMFRTRVRFRKRRRRSAFGATSLMVSLVVVCALADSPAIAPSVTSSTSASSAAFVGEAPPGTELIGTTVVSESKPAPPPVVETFHFASGPITPARLRIPSIGVDASVKRVGLQRDGSMGVPDNLWISGWLSSSARPGQAGSSVIAGHRGIGSPALFSHLEDLKQGDRIRVSDAGRGELVYEVTRVATLDLSVESEIQVFGRTSQQQLVLITCFGQYSRASRTYDQRLVVFSRLLPPGS
jgi:LPXTG-site transpeptidase (sortase) family protein